MAFDAVERPVATLAEAWVQSDGYMDLLALGWRVQRVALDRARRGARTWFGIWDVPTGQDLRRVSNQVAGLEREVRELRRAAEETGRVAQPPASPRRTAGRDER